MAEKEKDEAPKVEATPASAGMNPKMLMGLMGLNMVIMLAVVIVLFLGQRKKDASVSVEQIAQGAAEGGHGAAAPAAGAGHGEPAKGGAGAAAGGTGNDIRFFGIGDFTSNLAGPASSHYVKVNVNFELSKDVDEEELKKRKSQIRDKVISLLNSKKPADLQNVDGQNFLKEEIKTSVNGVLQTGKVEGVYFSTFIVN